MHEDQSTEGGSVNRWGESGASPAEHLDEFRQQAMASTYAMSATEKAYWGARMQAAARKLREIPCYWDSWKAALPGLRQGMLNRVVGHNPQLLLTDERRTVRYSAYQQVLAFRAAYPSVVNTYSKIAEQAAQLMPAVNGMFGRIYGQNLRGRDPDMLQALIADGEVVFPKTGRWRHDHEPSLHRIEHVPPTILLLDIETDFSEVEKRVLRMLERKSAFVNEQMMIYGLGSLAHESRFHLIPEETCDDEPTKQNGRSASYLKHDKTKNHKRRKRK